MDFDSKADESVDLRSSDVTSASGLSAPESASVETLCEILKPKLDLLVACFSHSWGGLEQTAANDALDLGGLGLKVRVLCEVGTPIHQNLKGRSEVELVEVGYRPRDLFDLNLKRDLENLTQQGVNVVHTHQTTFLASICPWVWRARQVAVFASRHILNNHNKRSVFHRLIYSRLDALVVMSETLRRNVLLTHAIRKDRVRLVKLGLDFDRFNPEKVDVARQRAEWGADADTVVVGLVGRIDPAKGQAAFIRAAAGLTKNLKPGEKLKFVIVGEETLGRASTYLEELREMVRQFHLESMVVFAGYRDNIPEVMSSFDLFVMPSRQEAFGLVAIEAMAMECPILVSSGGSASEIVGQQEFGLLVRPDDAFDLATQLRFLLDRPELRAQMGKRARSHVLRQYDRRVRIQKTLELYQQALVRRGVL